MSVVERVVIVGSGPAGYTAALYAARAGLSPLVLEGFPAGGQLITTTEVENFPGFPEGILGSELVDRMRQQAEKYGARFQSETVASVELGVRPFRVVTTEAQTYETQTLIVATGATARRLGVTGEDLWWQRGISACAVCDGALPMFRKQPLAVVGGGDTACEEALFLARFASRVYVLVRGTRMRASQILQERVLHHPCIEVRYGVTVVEALGENQRLTGIRLCDSADRSEAVLGVKGLFYALGHTPNTAFLGGQLDLDAAGYVRIMDTQTNVPGVFAVGDVQDPQWRQAITAAASGCMGALSAERYLSEHQL